MRRVWSGHLTAGGTNVPQLMDSDWVTDNDSVTSDDGEPDE